MAGKVFTTADLHLGHITAAEARGFKTVEEHDKAVIDSIFETVGPRDVLWVLGDVCFKGFDHYVKLMLDRLNADQGYVKRRDVNLRPQFITKIAQGNHDDTKLLIRLREEGWINTFAACHAQTTPHGKVLLSHIPVHECTLDRWSFNVHGHLHEKYVESKKYQCVSWEQGRRPVELNSIFSGLKYYED